MATSSKATKIEFLQFHQPYLKSGDYDIKTQQKLNATGVDVGDKDDYKSEMKFSVLGNRYDLPPNLISGVFPQAGGLGAYSNVMPHVILNRSTLPWERQANAKDNNTPWLALLLFDEEELVTMPLSNPTKDGTSTISYKDFKKGGTTSIKWPVPNEESGSHDEDRLLVLDVNWQTLQKVIPINAELANLSHVRQAETATNTLVGKEQAVIIGNRLPKAGSTSIVHLVSIEDRMDNTGSFDYQGAKDSDKIRLVSLKHWKFSCLKKNHTFSGLLLHLNQQSLFNLPFNKSIAKALNLKQIPATITTAFEKAGFSLKTPVVSQTGLWDIYDRDYHYIIDTSRNVYDGTGVKLFTLASQRLTNGKITKTMVKKFKKHGRPLLSNALAGKKTSSYWWINDGKNSYFISTDQGQMHAIRLNVDKKPTLRLPDTENTEANQLLENGFVPMPHQLRKGGRTVSWYRSPLATLESTQEIAQDAFPVHSADELMRYDENLGMLDVSYASAWELGRLMMLKNKLASVALWQWKRHHQQLINQTRQQEQYPHIPMTGANIVAAEFPKQVENFLSNLSLLKGIPFNYLVPDERQLPKESIRYFNIDPDWVASLIDGAFSIGRITQNDKKRDINHRKNLETLSPYKNNYSGFIMRSTVVKGWPGLEVDGYDVSLSGELAKGGKIKSTPLGIVRMQRLSSDTLLVVFKGDLKVLDIHLKPEALHFGLDVDPSNVGQYTKIFRNSTGKQYNDASLSKVPIDTNRKVNIGKLYSSASGFSSTLGFTSFSSAQFALCMIEGVQKVRFLKG